MLIPDYPKTSKDGVIHFIHCSKPLIADGAGKDDVRSIITQLMSGVSILPVYPKCIPSIY
jgi:hypothetical protein